MQDFSQADHQDSQGSRKVWKFGEASSVAVDNDWGFTDLPKNMVGVDATLGADGPD